MHFHWQVFTGDSIQGKPGMWANVVTVTVEARNEAHAIMKAKQLIQRDNYQLRMIDECNFDHGKEEQWQTDRQF